MQQKIGVLPPFQVEIDGVTHVVDHGSFAMRDRRAMRVALSKLTAEDGLLPDEADVMAAALWIVLRRGDESLDFDAVYDAYDLSVYASAEAAAAAEPVVQVVEDDNPEA